MKLLIWAAVWLVALYFAAAAAMYAFQRSLLYPVPQASRTTPVAAGFPQAEEIFVKTRDGEQVILWHVPPAEGRPVVIFLHGNGEVLAWRVPLFRALTEDGTGLVALSFRGYGGSSGSPTEQGLLADGEAAYEFAAARYAAARIVPWGYSLGSGVAVPLATTHPVGGLVLEAPFTSAVDVAAGAFPVFPVRWLMRDRFHSDRRIAELKAPLLVVHGDSDTVVPIALGRRLFELAPEPKHFVAVAGGTHVDLHERGSGGAVRTFLQELGQKRE
jgi:pimeloyl-ACP methyl ester carboxylesterase